MNSKCGVQSKRRCKSHEFCICIVGFPACRCQKIVDTVCHSVLVSVYMPTLFVLGVVINECTSTHLFGGKINSAENMGLTNMQSSFQP